ncbi:MAG TPA: hypothetical protein VFT70_17725 [Nocardioides sp.]|nr:hypothetical protein [Nocardioides sp.]
MKPSLRAGLTAAALVISTTGLAGAGSLTADASAPSASDSTTTARAALPKLTFTISKSGTIKLTHGPKTFRPGRVAFTVKSKSRNATLGFSRFDKGYSFKHFRSDLVTAFSKGDMKRLKNAIRHTSFYGGYGAGPGGTMSGTVVLPRAGTYTLYNFGGNAPKSPLTLRVKGAPQKRPAPKSDGTITAVNGLRFGGSSSLPHQGTLTFRNKAKDSPHFLDLIQVEPGTTKQDVDDYFQSGSQDPPDFFIADAGSTEVVGPGQSMTWNYDLPAGTYVELCFFPDPNMDGMPHAMMGMTRVITLQ